MSYRRLSDVYTTYILLVNEMAIVKAPAMSMEASGNVGDINFTRWRGLSIARATYTPEYTPSGLQLQQRANLKFVSEKWGQELTPANRKAWEERAAEWVMKDRLGQEYRPSGFQLFMKINIQAKVFSMPVSADPPGVPDPVYVWKVDVYPIPFASGNQVTMEKSFTHMVDADGFQIFRAGPYASGGRRPIEPEYRQLAIVWLKYFYNDYAVDDKKWYWYKCRWFFGVGFVGNWWEVQMLTDFPI